MDAAALIDDYVSSYRRRSAEMAGPDEELVDEDGVVGSLDRSPTRTGGRLLITDDRALPMLRELAPDVPAAVITVLSAAAECTSLMATAPRFSGQDASAMVCRDLAALPSVPLPDGLTIKPVGRLPDDEADAVPIAAAAAACLAAEQVPLEVLDGFVAYLTGLPPASRLFVAVLPDGAVRATAGYGCFGGEVHVFFVSTDQDWRGRGVATAMTAAALHAGRERGGVRACLDASRAGFGIYRRLGFEVASPVTLFIGP